MRRLTYAVSACALLLSRAVNADDPSVAQARAEFVAGTEHVKAAKWGEAIAAFERSRALHRHALTTYNIGACERALGRYTRARRSFLESIDEDKASGGKELGETFVAEANGYLTEISGLLAKVDLTIAPSDATLAFDGRPLAADGKSAGMLVSAIAAPGPGTTVGGHAIILTDPGAHVLLLSRKGYGDVVVNRTFSPGTTTTLSLELERLPGVLKVRADRDGAVVTIDSLDVGTSPVSVSRTAGSHAVVVRKSGYVPYKAQVELRAGEELDLRATLAPESIPITQKWWFWTGAIAVVGGLTAGSYFLFRPGPTRPPIDAGGLSWAATVH